MSSNFGTWSPNDLILPVVEPDVDYKFFFVKDSGSIEGLNISFNEGDWLVYIKENGKGNWFKTSGGAISVALPSLNSFPDPGFYTKVRLDNFGQIIDADYISKDDLPKHEHDISDITGNLESKVKKYVADMFQNSQNGTVVFTYDKDTQTISADVSIDDDTITKNEWGELEAQGSSGGNGGSHTSTTITGKIKIEQVQDLSNRLLAIDSDIKKNFIICRNDSGLEKKLDPNGNGTYLSVKFDGTSLVLNADGELSVSPSVLLGGKTDGSDTSCGAHTHTVSQITDFEKSVLDLISQNKTIDITQIPIDGETIIINSNGHLACVSAGVKAHKHSYKDIQDLDPNKVTVWAANQSLQDNEDYTKGKLNLTGQTIGYSVKVINEYLKDIDDRITSIEDKIGTIEVPEPNNIEYANFTVKYNNETSVYDINEKTEVTAGNSLRVQSDLFYPANEGTISVVIDENKVFELKMDSSALLYYSDTFKILTVKDSYYDNAMYRGTYNSMQVEYNVSDEIDEGYHKMYFQHEYNGEIHTSREINFQTYKLVRPEILISDLKKPTNNSYVSGIPCYTGGGEVSFIPKVKNAYTKCFSNKVIFQYRLNDTDWIQPNVVSLENGIAYFDKITISIPKETNGITTVYAKAIGVGNKEQTYSFKTPQLVWNNTNVEEYRVIHSRDFDGQSPIDIGSQSLNTYNPTSKLPQYEMVIQDNIGSLIRENFESINGPDYSTQMTDQNGFVWCNFKFPAPFMNNLHVSIVDKDGNAFKQNKNGSLRDLKLYASMSDNNYASTWVDGNVPYKGYGSAEGIMSNGLDLFKSTNTVRHITFGQQPNIKSGYLYVKVGVTKNIDLGLLVESIKESINEWS